MTLTHFDEEENGFVAVGGAFATDAEGIAEEAVESGTFYNGIDFCGAEADTAGVQSSVAVMEINMEGDLLELCRYLPPSVDLCTPCLWVILYPANV